MDLADIISVLGSSDADTRKKMLGDADAMLVGKKFIALPGPQTRAYLSKADILLFGGSPGGGKTALQCGLAFNEHSRSLIARREFVDLEGVLHTAQNILGGSSGMTFGNRPKYKDGERTIEFIGLGEELGGKQGNPHDLICVGKDTPVLMADGEYKQAQNVVVGDLVATLDGPRRVLNAFATTPKDSVRVKLKSGISQIQSATHKLLTTEGWVSRDAFASHTQPSICAPNVYRIAHIFFALSSRILQVLLPHRARRNVRPQPSFEEPEAALLKGQTGLLACDGHTPQPAQGNEHAASGGKRLPLRLRLLSFVSKLVLPSPHLMPVCAAQSFPYSACGCDVRDVQRTSLRPSCLAHCLFYLHLCGERILEAMGSCVVPTGDPRGLLLLADVARRNPTDLREGVPGVIPKRSPRTWWYDHPYTKEKRQSVLSVSESSCDVSPVGMVELFDLEVEGANHFITMGGFVNKNCIDEVAQVPEFQVRMLLGWMRTNKSGQRCRMVMGSNPPLDAVGDWLLDFFAPWLNPQYPNPAEEGELRYFLPRDDGFPGDRECGKDDTCMIGGVEVTPLSRTFISSKFTDNPYYDPETYAKSLAGLPDSVRERLISGNFITTREDDEMQCIPTDWVRQAQARWTAQAPVGVPMCALGVDVAVGGKDEFVIAKRFDGWFAPLVKVPGNQVRDGKTAAGLVMANRHDNAAVIVDVGGGFGADCHGHLQKNGIDSVPYMGINTVRARTKDGTLPISNRRSQSYWQFREALDPSQLGGSPIMLPPDNKLVADLCAPKYKVSTRGIEVEPKVDVNKKLGRSTDCGDSVVMAWSSGLKQSNVQGGFRVKGTQVNVMTRYKRR